MAAISANDDDAVGAVIAKALHTVGDGGIVTVEESAAHGMSRRLRGGLRVRQRLPVAVHGDQPGQPAKRSSTTRTSCCAARRSPRSQQLMPLLDKIMRAPRPLVIIAETVEGTALSACWCTTT